MAIKYYCMPEKGKIVGVLDGTERDVVNKIDKICADTNFIVWPEKKFLMPRSFKAEANVQYPDVYNEEVGKEIVRQKIMKRYYASHDKKIRLFKTYLNELIQRTERKIK